jgi:hypothetical protein
MWNTFSEATVTIVLAIVGLAIVATLVSKNAQTGNIIRNAASGLGNNIAVAESPVTGINVAPNLSYANSLGMGFGS